MKPVKSDKLQIGIPSSSFDNEAFFEEDSDVLSDGVFFEDMDSDVLSDGAFFEDTFFGEDEEDSLDETLLGPVEDLTFRRNSDEVTIRKRNFEEKVMREDLFQKRIRAENDPKSKEIDKLIEHIRSTEEFLEKACPLQLNRSSGFRVQEPKRKTLRSSVTSP